jgi:hypothetical protein
MPATYEPIATTTLGSAAATITFSSIAATWTDLRLIFVGTFSVNNKGMAFRLNSDTGTNYSLTDLSGNGSTASSNRISSFNYGWGTYSMALSSTVPELITLDFFNYAGSTFKTFLGTGSGDRNDGTTTSRVERNVQLWRSTSAITSITLSAYESGDANFSIGTTATLYGIKNA